MDPIAPERCWRSSCGRYTVKVNKKCLDGLSEVASKSFPFETGAVLIGSYSDDGSTAYIQESGIMPSDSKRRCMSFVRGVKGLQNFFKRIYADSSGQVHYVGEWHSHPNGAAIPSRTDDATLHDICKDKKTGCPETILLLVGIDVSRNAEFGVFVYSRDHGRISLNEITTTSC